MCASILAAGKKEEAASIIIASLCSACNCAQLLCLQLRAALMLVYSAQIVSFRMICQCVQKAKYKGRMSLIAVCFTAK